MARGSQQATTAATSAQNLSNQFAGNANALYSTLAPELESEAAHPAGFNPAELADMNTAAQQSAGGATAGAVSQGALRAARTGNLGGSDAAIQEAARNGGQTASKAAVGIKNQNAMLKQNQRRAALSGLQGLYGTNAGASIGSLGQVANNVNADTNAENASWNCAKYILDPALNAAGGAAGGYYRGAKP